MGSQLSTQLEKQEKNFNEIIIIGNFLCRAETDRKSLERRKLQFRIIGIASRLYTMANWRRSRRSLPLVLVKTI